MTVHIKTNIFYSYFLNIIKNTIPGLNTVNILTNIRDIGENTLSDLLRQIEAEILLPHKVETALKRWTENKARSYPYRSQFTHFIQQLVFSENPMRETQTNSLDAFNMLIQFQRQLYPSCFYLQYLSMSPIEKHLFKIYLNQIFKF